jgi:DNA-binding GntR family transcriptional regulator
MTYKCKRGGCDRTFQTERARSTHETTGHDKKYTDEEWLREKYHGEGLYVREMAEECGVTRQTIRDWMDRLGVERRDKSEAKSHEWDKSGEERREEYAERMAEIGSSYAATGEDNGNWKDEEFHSLYYGPSWSKELKEKVRERDNRTCQVCGFHTSEFDYTLPVHHMTPFRDYGLENHEKANREDNLITLCCSCHRGIHAAMEENR